MDRMLTFVTVLISAAATGLSQVPVRPDSRPAPGQLGVPDPVPPTPRPPGLDGALGPAGPIFGNIGLTRTADGLFSAGPNYLVEFRDDGVIFTPVLGSRAPDVRPLRLRLLSVARRGAPESGFDARPAAPVDAENEVAYPRTGYTETYELGADGVEQSFVFAALPPGSGDLVVRLAVETELPVAGASEGEVRFERDGIGGVRIGDVVGIDAAGRRAAGSIAHRGGELALALPADFVDRAALPLVLDPIITGIFAPGGHGQEDVFPDVAYDATNDVHLFVWARVLANPLFHADVSIMGQRVRIDALGRKSLVGGLITIRDKFTHFLSAPQPSVANVDSTDSFVVAWDEQNDIMAATFAAQGGGDLYKFNVTSTPDLEGVPKVGGDGGATGSTAIICWRDSTDDSVEAARIQTRIGAQPDVGPVVTLHTSATIGRPRISKSTDDSGRHLIVWHEGSTPRIQGVVVDRDLASLTSNFFINTSWYGCTNPAVDGDGSRWIVAYEQQTVTGDTDIYCKGVEYDEASGTWRMGFAASVEAGREDPERAPAVAWMGDSALVGFEDLDGADWNTYVTSVDPFDCGRCEGEFVLDGSAGNTRLVAMASQRRGAAPANLALIVWDAGGEARAAGFRADDGQVTRLTAGCGQGGTAYATCAISGNRSFDLRLRGGAPGGTALLLWAVGFSTVPSACGAPQLLQDALIFSGGIDSQGNVARTFDIDNPALIGGIFHMQWLTFQAPATVSVSGILRVVVE